MAVLGVRNGSDGWLVLWIEPLGEDRWLMPGETFQVRSTYVGERQAFTVDFCVNNNDRAAGIENIVVWVDEGDIYAEVTDGSGNVVECGHQRPTEIDEKWNAALAEARKRIESQKPGGS